MPESGDAAPETVLEGYRPPPPAGRAREQDKPHQHCAARPAPARGAPRPPPQLVLDKEIAHLDVHCRALIGLSPFLTMATADADGWPEISPRGGDPGFVKVLDEHRLVLPDRQGNNRLDSLRKVAVNPRVALLFFVPGVEETLKVFGTAELLAADALDVDLTEFGRAPRSVLVVTVQRAYLQCAKAVMRSGPWDPAARGDRTG